MKNCSMSSPKKSFEFAIRIICWPARHFSELQTVLKKDFNIFVEIIGRETDRKKKERKIIY